MTAGITPENLEKISFQEDAPTIKEVQQAFENDPLRPNPTIRVHNSLIRSIISGGNLTEKDAVTNIVEFIESVKKESLGVDEEIHESSSAFGENLRYIGQGEFNKAIDYFADDVWKTISQGQRVIFLVPGDRSEFFVTANILNSLRRQRSGNLRSVVRYTRSLDDIPKNMGDLKLFVADDFVLSGTRIRTQSGRLEHRRPDLLKHLEFLILGCNTQVNTSDFTLMGEPIPINAYYGVSPYFNSSGSQVVHGNVSITGSHCSTDYGFENPIFSYGTFLEQKGITYEKKLPIDIQRPYETDRRGNYRDPSFAQMVGDIKEFELWNHRR